MRAYVPAFEMQSPASLSELFQKVEKEPGKWQLFAGGTDLMVLFESGTLPAASFLSLHKIKELQGIQVEKDKVVIGATTHYGEIQENAVLRQEFPNLCVAGSLTGSVAIQNRGTLGGNIMNASPAGDSLPALMAYDAVIEMRSAQGVRLIPYHEFHLGYKKTAALPSEVLYAVHLPRKFSGWRHYYRKVGTRNAQAISKVVMAAMARKEGKRLTELRVALGSVGPMTIRCHKTENVLQGQELNASLLATARNALTDEIAPIDDIRSTGTFRLEVAANLLEQFLEENQ